MPDASITTPTISANSKRVARNTVFLYFRMLLLMFIGLFTSRVVLKTLGVDDYGIYNAVGGVVSVFTFLTNSLSSAIGRFLAYEMGKEDIVRMRKVFCTGMVIQMIASLLIVLLVETLGLWFLNHKMVIDPGRMPAANIVLHCSLGVLVLNLLAVPYNATIIAHEKMSAYAFISILEAALKFGVAAVLLLGSGDKLVLYAFLMLGVAFIVRFTYSIYCRHRFIESHGRFIWDPACIREMGGFAGWSFLGSSSYVFNTQGVNIVLNLFFGTVANAARGIALQIEGIARGFVTNILTAFNPQITKTWAANDRQYCFELVLKASKYSCVVLLAILIPFWYESSMLINIWLGQIPEHSIAFSRLTLVILLLNLCCNPLHILQQATGNVRKYFIITGITAYLAIPAIYLAFKLGMKAEWAYIVLAIVYSADFIEKVLILHSQTDFPISRFIGLAARMVSVALLSLPLPLLCRLFIAQPWPRLLCVCFSSWLSISAGVWFLALTPGERSYIKSFIHK